MARPPLYITLLAMMGRGAANSLFAASWTAGLSAVALLHHALSGDPSLAGRLTGPWARGLARTWGMQVRAFGTQQLDPSRPYVFISNHASHVDIIALLVALPIQPGFLAKKELRRTPFFGRAMEVAGHVFVDRTNRKQAFASIVDAARQVSAGKPIVIFPEGTRSDGRHVGRFKKGGFHLAKQALVPVVPIGIRGSANVLPKDGKTIHGGSVEVHVGEPIPPSEIERLSVDGLMGRVRQAICALSELPSI